MHTKSAPLPTRHRGDSTATSPSPDGPTKLVQMRLRPATMERVARLQEQVEAENRTQAVVRAVQIADWLVTAIKQGATVSLEWPDGKKETIAVVGI